ncbi:TPA_asm: non-structural polyprotein [Neosmilaster georgianus associated picornavirus 3]|nr:TPA_asm: non-structural polyprotein [Neosmilaster georgianus associated picornavirus 3]
MTVIIAEGSRLNVSSPVKGLMDPSITKLTHPENNEMDFSISHPPLHSQLQPQGIFDSLGNAQEVFDAAKITIESVTTFVDTVKKAVAYDGTEHQEFTDNIISRLEDLLLVIVSISSMDSIPKMIAPMLAYFKTCCPGSIFQKVRSMLIKLMSETETQKTTQAGWLETNFRSLTKGSVGTKLSQAINLMIMAGFMPENMDSFIGTEFYTMFNVQATGKRMHTTSIFEYVFSTIDWFLESVIPACQAQDLSLLFSANDMFTIDKMYRDSIHTVELWVSGQHDLVKEKYKIVDEASILVMLEDCAAAHYSLVKHTTDDAMRRELNSRILKLQHITSDLTSSWHTSGIRVKPYAVLIRGGTSVAKSQISTVVNHIISSENDLPMGKEHTCTINGNDKYQSNYRSHHICVVFDDMGNTRYERAEGNPLFVLIQFINNMHCAALSPEAEKKGKMDIRCKIVLVTTNTVDLGACYFSNNPASILRRFDLVLDISMKPECLNAEGNIDSRFIDQPIPNMWVITAHRVHITRKDVLIDDYELKSLINKGDICDLIPVLQTRSKEHLTLQTKLVNAQTDIHTKESCEHHPNIPVPCVMCAKQATFTPDLSKQDGEHKEPLDHTRDPPPSSLISTYPIRDFLEKRNMECTPGTVDSLKDCDKLDALGRLKVCCKDAITSLTEHRKSAIEMILDADPKFKIVFGVATAMAAIGGMVFALTPKKTAQGTAYSKLLKDFQDPANLKSRDVSYADRFKKVVVVAYSHSDAAVSTPVSVLRHKIDKNLAYTTVRKVDPLTREHFSEKRCLNILPVGGGWWIVPGHTFNTGHTLELEARLCPPGTVGGRIIRELVDESNTVPLVGTDAALIYLKQGGDNYDFSKFFLKDDTSTGHENIALYTRAQSCIPPSDAFLSGKVTSKKMLNISGVGIYHALEYKLSDGNTFDGMCGSVVVSDSPNPSLLGIHTAGRDGTPEGACALITSTMIETAKNSFRDMMRISTTTDLPKQMVGIDIGLDDDVHFKSPVHKLSIDEPDENFELFGQHKIGTSKFRSDVIRSCISESLEKDIGIECDHVAPTRKAAEHSFATDLKKMATSRPPLVPQVLEKSIDDFKQKINQFLKTKKGKIFRDHVHTLNLNYGINGKDGVTGMDKINSQTSFSFPLNMKKINLMFKKAFEDITSGNQVELEFDSNLVDMDALTEEGLDALHRGERVNYVVRGSGKDEAITIQKSKDSKVRIFAGARADMVIIARMLFLPTITAMGYHPEIFESMVGINPCGKDWAWYTNFISQFGTLRFFNGDFKAFDKEMSASIALGAWDVLIHVCRESGMSPDVILMMQGLATECVYPIYELQGILVKIFGSNPSGHALTVIINGFANSIYMRYAYYMMHWRAAPKGTSFSAIKIPLFHTMVILSTFGDDNLGAVNASEELFNHTSVQYELQQIGVHYTMSDKTSESRPFIGLEECDFIKRTLTVHPQILAPVGSLDLKSVGKMLHMTRTTRGNQEYTEAQITAKVMESAMDEYYYHSEELYNQMLPKLQALADRSYDPEGNPLAPHFKPNTPQDLLDRYDATSCIFEVPESGWQMQSRWDDDDSSFSQMDPDEAEAIWYASLESEDEEEDEPTLVNFPPGDYRTLSITTWRPIDLASYLHLLFCQKERQRRQLKRVHRDMREFWDDNLFAPRGRIKYSPWNDKYTGSGFFRAAAVFRNLMARSVDLPPDIQKLIGSFLAPAGSIDATRMIENMANDIQPTDAQRRAHSLPTSVVLNNEATPVLWDWDQDRQCCYGSSLQNGVWTRLIDYPHYIRNIERAAALRHLHVLRDRYHNYRRSVIFREGRFTFHAVERLRLTFLDYQRLHREFGPQLR